MTGEKIQFVDTSAAASAQIERGAVPGSAGLRTQLPGQAATVSGLAMATGGIGGNFVEPAIDKKITKIKN